MTNDQVSTGLADPPANSEIGAPVPTETQQTGHTTATGSNGFTSSSTASGSGAPNVVGPPKTLWREYFESAVVTVIMALFGMTFIVQAVKVPTGSMQNTILIGDHLLVNKFIFAPGPPLPFLPQREVRRGDIVVFKYPGNKDNPERDNDPTNTPFTTNYVKRVIALPGDRLEIRNSRVYINGQPLPEHRVMAVDRNDKAPLEIYTDPPRTEDEPYVVYYPPHEGFERMSDFRYGVGQPVVVPPSHYFVMGDNRDNSSDSRVWGFVPRDLIVGRAMFVYWSYDESAVSSGNFLVDFFQNTRWSRTGTMIK